MAPLCVFVEGGLAGEWLSLYHKQRTAVTEDKGCSIITFLRKATLPPLTPAANCVSFSQLDSSQTHDVISSGGGGDNSEDDDGGGLWS